MSTPATMESMSIRETIWSRSTRRDRGVQIDGGDDAVQVDPLDHRLDIELGGHRVQVDVVQDDLGQVELGQRGVDDPGDHRPQQRLDQLLGAGERGAAATLGPQVQPPAALARVGHHGLGRPRGQPATEPDRSGGPPGRADRQVNGLVEYIDAVSRRVASSVESAPDSTLMTRSALMTVLALVPRGRPSSRHPRFTRSRSLMTPLRSSLADDRHHGTHDSLACARS